MLLMGSLACIFPPKHPAFIWWADHAVFVALGFLAIGLFFLTINKSRLMFVCLGCSAAISFFKNELGEAPTWPDKVPPISKPVNALPNSQTTPDSLSLKPAPQNESSETSR